jgi:PAS domain S-box-containing protein
LILGYEPDELVGKTRCYDLVPPGTRNEVKTELLSAFGRREKIENFISPNSHKNGNVVILETTGVPVYDTGGAFIGYRGIDLDITEHKRADDAVKKANKQLILLNSITRHDILNQLNSFTGYLAMMKKIQMDGNLSDLLRKEEAIAETIRRMITFTRDYQNIGVKPPEWQNISELLRNVLTITEKGSIAFTLDIDGLEVYADQLIEKVFFNLMENSVRHGESVSTITIRAAMRDRDLILVYEDNGVGIPAEEKETIFDRGHGKNTGYGLFLAREILAITGLSLSETGIPGKGVRFEILVPAGSFRFGGKPGNEMSSRQ